MIKLFSVLILLTCLFSSLAAIEIKPLREITLSQSEEAFIQYPGTFVVTEDDRIFVFDYKAGHIKIFDADGKLVKIFGKKGMGPHEFVRPHGSSYKAPYVAFTDYGRKSFFIYKRTGKERFEFVNTFLCLELADDFHFLDDGNLLISGYKVDKNQKAYHLYKYDLKNKNYEFILPSEVPFGFKSYKRYRKEYVDKIAYIGPKQFCDFSDDRIYYVWEGNINIIKINRKTKETSSFGKKTENYFQPHLTPEIKRAYDRRDHRALYKLKKEMSYIADIFVLNSNNIGLVYAGPLKDKKGMNVMLQVYKPNGDFIKEFEVLNAKASHRAELDYYFSKGKNLFYIMDTETSEEFDQFYKIHEYRIEE